MRRVLTVAAIALSASLLITAAETPPKLVVLIVVDQMRADYIERFKAHWSAGLNRLVRDGAWFTRAAYPYLDTVTCAGHATIATGSFPHTHGVFANTWFDRARNAVVPCTDDPQAPVVAYGAPEDVHAGPGALKVPTLADQMRGSGSKVVTLALKARSAIMMAGHGGTAVTWVSESFDRWETSAPFAQAPVPEVQAYLAANPMSADYGKTWSRLLPDAQYRDTDAGLAEAPIRGWTATFPHVLNGDGATSAPDAVFYDQWQHSPFADAYVARMAGAMVQAFHLGAGATPDFLAVSFSSPDLVGHSFGPQSQEIQDMYARLDQSVGDLLGTLDRTVGVGNYVVALTADHGVTAIPEQLTKAGRDAGRLDTRALVAAGNAAAERMLGQGKYINRIVGNDVYFEPGMYDKVTASPKASAEVIGALMRQPGVRRVFASAEVAHGAKAGDAELRAAALSYVTGRSGDLILSPKAGWMFSGNGTTHGSANADDQRVPIVLFGAGVKPGRYAQRATPADVAPTLAALAGVTLTGAEGRSLKEALR